MKAAARLLDAVLVFLASAPALADGHALLDRAKKERAPRFAYARDQGADISLTSDKKTFYVLWLPEGSTPLDPPPMIVTIHGHGSWAIEEFYHWHEAAKARGYGILALQWWMGEGERFQDYLSPEEIYEYADEVLSDISATAGTCLFHGFSRGSANTYAVAALDRAGAEHFALFVANAGKPGLDFPPNVAIQEGKYGEKPLAGSHWVTYGGGRDPHPQRDGWYGMREAGEWITKYGGTVELAIEDPEGDHGGFHKRPENMEKALDLFERLRQKP